MIVKKVVSETRNVPYTFFEVHTLDLQQARDVGRVVLLSSRVETLAIEAE